MDKSSFIVNEREPLSFSNTGIVEVIADAAEDSPEVMSLLMSVLTAYDGDIALVYLLKAEKLGVRGLQFLKIYEYVGFDVLRFCQALDQPTDQLIKFVNAGCYAPVDYPYMMHHVKMRYQMCS